MKDNPKLQKWLLILLIVVFPSLLYLALNKQVSRQFAFWPFTYQLPQVPQPVTQPTPTSFYQVIEEFPVVNQESMQEKPDIYGNNIVWIDWRPIPDFPGISKTFLYRLDTGQERRLQSNHFYHWHVAVSDNSAVYVSLGSYDSLRKVLAYYLNQNQEMLIETGQNDSIELYSPDISSSRLVWVNYDTSGAGSFNIKQFDFETQQISTIKKEKEYRVNVVRTEADKVVWNLFAEPDKIFYKDLSSGQEQRVGNDQDLFDRKMPDINQQFIVWQDHRAGKMYTDIFGVQRKAFDIYGLSLNNVLEFPIASGDLSHEFPKIHDRLVVWQDNRQGNWDIYGSDLITCRQFPIAVGQHDEMQPAVYGNIVVWQDWRHDRQHPNDRINSDIYAARLNLPSIEQSGSLVNEPCPSRQAFITPTPTVTPVPVVPTATPLPIPPDLTVQLENLGIFDPITRRITRVSPERPIRVGDVVVVDVRGKETTGVDVHAHFITRVELYYQNQLVGSYDDFPAGLWGGSNFAFRVSWSKIPFLGSPGEGIRQAGDYRLVAIIDSTEVINEVTEENNRAVIDFEVLP